MNEENIENQGLTEPNPSTSLIKYTPNNPPWNSLEALGLWLLSVVAIVILPTLAVIPYLLKQNIKFSDPAIITKAAMEPGAILIQIATIIPAHILTVLVAWMVITRFNKHSFTKMLGWNWAGYNWWQVVLIMVGLLVLVFGVSIAMSQIFGQKDNDLLKILRSSRYAVFLVAFMATISAPFVEEVIYRGVLYSAFQRTFSIPIAVLLVTLVFALVHFPQYWGDYATLTTLLFLSLVITLIRVKTGSLLPCILFHFLINGIQSALLILQPYLPEALDPTRIQSFFFG
ncbi:MAG: CPBP family intramembrane metalloprotease [Acidobacteriota bacterium]|jgi:membrane protease YdiL (CAAX protease family)|nr:CPBP family intramembrane metalloprotease [Acidobacteriota bacterium]